MILTSEKPEIIEIWASHCLEHRLFEPKRFAERCFRGDFAIIRMSFVPWLGWAMIHEYPNKEAQVSVFVVRFRRAEGHGYNLLKEVMTGYTGPSACADYAIAGRFFTSSFKKLYKSA